MRYLDTEKVKIAQSESYSWFVQFDGTVFRVHNKCNSWEKERQIVNIQQLREQKAQVYIMGEYYDVMDLVLKAFQPGYRTVNFITVAKDGNPMNTHGKNIRVFYKDKTRPKKPSFQVRSKNLIGAAV